MVNSPVNSPSSAVNVRERLARVRAATPAACQGGAVMQFANHHSDWGGFMNRGEIAK